MKTDYPGHDHVYQRRRTAGEVGWADAEVLAANNVKLRATLAAEYYPKSGRVLELGCGAGDLSLELAALGYEAFGVDIAPAAIEWARDKARERGLQADFQVGSVLDLAHYADDSFDLVLDGYCLHCIIGGDRPKFFAAAKRVLKPGGLLHINTMYGDDGDGLRTNPGSYDAVTRCQVFGGIAVRYFGLIDELLAEVTDVGFEIIRSEARPRPHENHSDMLLVDARKPMA